MGSGTYERQGGYLSTGASGGYTFVRFPNGESFNESTGKWTLYFETGFFVNAGNFYGSNFTSWGSSSENFTVYGPGEYHTKSATLTGDWNQSVTFTEGNGYTSGSAGWLESVADFYWYPDLPTYTIQYNANGGTGAPSSQTKTYGLNGGNDLTLSSAIPTRENYNFVGWATSDSATTAQYQAGGTYSANASTTLYAVWELAYLAPTNTLSAFRVTAGTTTRNANGTQVYATVAWAANRINSSDTASVTSVTASITEDGAAVSPTITWGGSRTGTSGTATLRFTASTAKTYVLTVTVTDSHGLTTVKSATISNIKYPIYVSHDSSTGTDTVKIDTLALGNPLPADSGGTGKTYGFAWQQIASFTTTTGSANISLSGYSEVMVCAESGTVYLGSAVLPVARLSSTAKEVYLGGGFTGYWGGSLYGGRAFAVKLTTTRAQAAAAYADNAEVSSVTWYVYAR